MTDDDLLETIRTRFADITLDAPLDEVLARGRRLRRHGRWLPAVGAGTTAVAAAALTFTLAGGGGPGPMQHASLTAFSVRSGPGRTVSLTIRNQRESGPDRERLRKALRAAGVPAIVATRLPAQCKAGSPVAQRIISFVPWTGGHGAVYRIQVRAIPRGTRVAVVVPAPRIVIGKAHGRTFIRLPLNAPLPEPLGLPSRHGRPSWHGQPTQVTIPPGAVLVPRIILISPAGLCVGR